MPGFDTGPLNVKKPFSIASLRPNDVYVEPSVTRTLPTARSGTPGALITVTVPASRRSAPWPLKRKSRPRPMSMFARGASDGAGFSVAGAGFAIAVPVFVAPRSRLPGRTITTSSDRCGAASSGRSNSARSTVNLPLIAIPPRGASFSTTALPDSDSLRSGAAKSSSLSATMLAVRSGSLPSSRTRPIARSVPSPPWNSTCWNSTRFSVRRTRTIPSFSCTPWSTSVADRSSPVSVPESFGFAGVPATVSLSAARPSSR
ncbi:Uncharacterised protein [Burkholderia pseudomallei]|nr:Uncharacterised protein [Burkholderia pseudomallei]